MEVMLQQGSGFRIALFSTIPWCLWQQRNRLREHQPSWPLHEIGARAKDLVMEYVLHQPSWPLHEIGARAKDLVMEYFKVHKQAL